MKNNLTIILLLKEREEFTLRFIEFFLRNNFNYNLFIADGSKKKLGQSILNKIRTNSNITYKKFPEDKNYTIFYKKIISSLEIVKTKYVLFASNDDFLIYDTIDRCMKILIKYRDLNGAGGSIYSFSLSKNKKFIENINPLYFNLNFDQNHVKKRVDIFFTCPSSTMHYIMNRKNLLKSKKNAVKFFNNNIELMDFFTDVNNIINGKIKIINSPVLFHQSTPNSEASKRPEIILDNFKNKKFPEEIMKLIDIIYKRTKIDKFQLFKKYYKSEIIPVMKGLSFKSEISAKEMINTIKKKIIRRILPNNNRAKNIQYNVEIKKIENSINNFLTNFH